MCFIKADNLVYRYKFSEVEGQKTENVINAVDGISVSIKKGQFVSVIGANGSGKSTFAKHINALYTPYSGDMFVSGYNIKDKKHLWEIRRKVGIVFQNPDNQIVATVVEEDVAFGLENMGISSEEIKKRVDYALKCVGMSEYRKKTVSSLSGGQKQNVAVAGILAMQPECIIFDESTAMLDPVARAEMLKTILNMNKKFGITVIAITHFMEEAVLADRVIVFDKGKIVMDDVPKKIFLEVDSLKKMHLALPQCVEIANGLFKKGLKYFENIITVEDIVNKIVENKKNVRYFVDKKTNACQKANENSEKILEIKNVSHIFNENSDSQNIALHNINFTINKGEFISVIGHTGSGKSTLIQTFNGIIKPSCGSVLFYGEDINGKLGNRGKNKNFKYIRQKIGLVFQYPEHQLFEETVFKDVAYGPNNMGLSESEINERSEEALKSVGFDSSVYNKSPFELSGGEKRMVAVAGVLAMRPDVIVLDEPTAGLDPFHSSELLKHIKKINKQRGMTVVLVSHSMEQVAEFSDRILVMNNGKAELLGTAEQIFSQYDKIEKFGLLLPQTTMIFKKLNEMGYELPQNVYTVSDTEKILFDFLR